MRYLPLGEADRSAMMAQIGISSVDDLFAGVPESARLTEYLDLPPGQGELAVERAIGAIFHRGWGLSSSCAGVC